jgi:hypothetical protein
MADKIDQSPKKVDLVLYSGDGIKFNLVFTNGDGQALDVHGDEFKSQIRVRRDDADSLVDFTIDATTQGADGIVIVSLDGTDTSTLTESGKDFSGFWDFEWTPSGAGAQPRTVCQGKVECGLDVSR